MRDEDVREVWSMLDREHLVRFTRGARGSADESPEVVFATISGAHLYGFASPDSDVDVRGAVLFPARAMLGLSPPDETLSVMEKEPVDVDFVALPECSSGTAAAQRALRPRSVRPSPASRPNWRTISASSFG